MRFVPSFAAAILVAGFAVSAHAVPVAFIDTHVPTSTVTLSANGANYSYTHVITPPSPATNSLQAYIDGVLTAGEGYDSTIDTLLEGTLTLEFGGASSTPGTNGVFALTLGGALLGSQNFATTIFIDELDFDVSLINDAGVLSVDIVRTNASGSVTFLSSVLSVSGVRDSNAGDGNGTGPNPTPVSEPMTMALFGLGLMGLGLTARRKRKVQA